MIPAALELLMRRLQIWDRKALHGAAMICAEVWNAAGMHLDREKLPNGMTAKDFLSELPEERARREAEEVRELEELARPIDVLGADKEQFEQYKAGLMKLTVDPRTRKAKP